MSSPGAAAAAEAKSVAAAAIGNACCIVGLHPPPDKYTHGTLRMHQIGSTCVAPFATLLCCTRTGEAMFHGSLRAFDETARAGSIRKASEALGVAPSSVSRHI